ncbi:OmpA family protein [Candidatus Marithioploca araucensis]|uniref:OmpA family protein n=1 Tax=Candidatus Marithioploca araucensis TaxID=70273 RepID=A0ABT7VQ71_9GAMM|nr:OmpA family protein [Candidatus Marithioploca araucensis]
MVLITNTCHAGLSAVFRSKSGLKLDIKFNFDSWVIKEESFVHLDSLSAEMKSQGWTSYKFVISGHTDSQGSSEYNRRLSQNRANAIKNYLVLQGIHPDRFVAKGYGEDKLLDKSNTEQAHRMNRRVVLKVLGTINKKNSGDTRILVFANLLDANKRVKLNLSNAISDFQSLYKKVQVKEVVSFTNEDCTRANVFKYLKKDKDTVNIVFFIGDIIVGNDNELYFKTVDTDNEIIEYSALKLADVIRIVNEDSFIVLPRHFSVQEQNLSTDTKIIAHQGILSYNEQLRLLSKVKDVFEKQYINASYGEYIGTVMKKIENIYMGHD